jgi:hypothetical protein
MDGFPADIAFDGKRTIRAGALALAQDGIIIGWSRQSGWQAQISQPRATGLCLTGVCPSPAQRTPPARASA